MSEEQKEEIQKQAAESRVPAQKPEAASQPQPEQAPAQASKAEPQPAQKPAEKPQAKKEKPSNCAGCNKSIKKKRWYYRNGKFYCTKRCWQASLKKDQTPKEAS